MQYRVFSQLFVNFEYFQAPSPNYNALNKVRFSATSVVVRSTLFTTRAAK